MNLILDVPVKNNNLVFYIDGKDFTNSPPTTTWIDRSRYKNNMQVINFGYTPSSGQTGNNSVVFNGISNYLKSLEVSKGMEFLQSGSIEASFKMITWASNYCIVFWEGGPNYPDISIGLFRFSSSSNIHGNVTNGSNWNNNASYPINLGTKYHVVYSWNTTSVKLYINGVLVYQGTNNITPNPSPKSLFVGMYYDSYWGSIYSCNMELFFIKVYKTELTDSQIYNNYLLSI